MGKYFQRCSDTSKAALTLPLKCPKVGLAIDPTGRGYRFVRQACCLMPGLTPYSPESGPESAQAPTVHGFHRVIPERYSPADSLTIVPGPEVVLWLEPGGLLPRDYYFLPTCSPWMSRSGMLGALSVLPCLTIVRGSSAADCCFFPCSPLA